MFKSSRMAALLLLPLAAGACTDTDPTGPQRLDGQSEARLTVAAAATDPGAARTVISFLPNQFPESVALGPSGTAYVGVRTADGTGAFVGNAIVQIDQDGDVRTVAELGPAPAGAQGLLGLAFDHRGNLYAAFASFNPATHGVYRLSPGDWEPERMAGSPQIVFPNGIEVDPRGSVYVSDSFAGVVWRHEAGGSFQPWFVSELLQPVPIPGFGPLPGANGIAYQPARGFFVSNTSQGSIVRIPVEPDGAPGMAEVLFTGFLGIDGVAASANGLLYFVNAGARILPDGPVPALYQVSPDGGPFVPVEVDDPNAFDDPTDLALGAGRADPGSLWVVNANIFPPSSPGAGVVQVQLR